MSAFQDAAAEWDDLKTRVAELEAVVAELRGHAPATSTGVPRTYYRPAEVAEIWGFKKSTVQAWIRDGRVDAIDMGSGGAPRYAVPAAVVQQGPPQARRAS